MKALFARLSLAAAALSGAVACAAPAPPPANAPAVAPTPVVATGRLERVGRGVVANTRTTDLWVFRGANGRDYAYTGTFGACQGCVGNRMYAWDVTDPARPVRTDSVVVDARVINDVVVDSAGRLGVITREGAENRRNGIVLLDLSDPAHPKPLSEYWETLTGGAHNAWIDGSFEYVVDGGTADMAVIDISDPRDPREVGRWGLPARPGKFLHDVTVRDGLAYLAYWDDGLVILDVGRGVKGGTPRQPRLVSQFRYRTEWRGEKHGNTHFALPYTNRAGRRYVFVGDEIFPPGTPDFSRPIATGGVLHVMDVTNPELVSEVATYEAPGAGVHNFWIRDDLLYMGAYSAGVRVLDVSGEFRGDIRNREVAAASTGDTAAIARNLPMTWAAMPYRDHVYASDLNSGLWVFRLVR